MSRVHGLVDRSENESICWLQGRSYDGKTDIWAIGCILYELCSLRKAFDAGNLGAITVKVMR